MIKCPLIASTMNHKILTDFFNKIQKPMLRQKARDVAAMRKKTDYKSLYNEVDLTLLEYIKLQLSLQKILATQNGSKPNIH